MGRPPLSKEKRKQLARERGIIVDEEDEWLLEYTTWLVHRTGYAVSWIWLDGKQKVVSLHHCIVGCPIWRSDEVDHEDGNKLNNRRDNISIGSVYKNKQNRDTVRNAKNIYQHSGSNTWFFRAYRNGVKFESQQYSTEMEAIRAKAVWLATSNTMENTDG